jgi:hypothetical protein
MDRNETGRNGARHERRDIRVGTVAWVGIVLLGLLAVIGHVVPWIAFKLMEEQPPPEGAAASPLEGFQLPPPPPRLQANPQADLARMRSEAEERLRSFGWADRPNGVVRMPIDRAMDLIVERGLPGTVPAPAQAGNAPASGARGK